MRDQIVKYIQVLKDRQEVFAEYYSECLKTGNRDDAIEYEGILSTIDDIVAELEGFVKAQDEKKVLLDRLAGEGNYAVDENGDYDVEASGGPPNPMIPSTGPAFDTRDGKGDYTKTGENDE